MKKIILTVLFFAMASLASAQDISQSTIDDQQSVEVTVYNNNLGLVKDTRLVTLPSGEGELRFMDVAARIMPVTVHIESLNLADQFKVLEQNYEYDLMNADKLLDKYVGREIKLLTLNEYQDKKEEVTATLLSNNNGQIFKINDEIYLGHPGYKILPEIPENLIAKPTLTWLYRNGSSQPHTLKVSYLTAGINWLADYVVVLDKADTSADLNGWVTLDNQSGAMYKDAKLKLVAGSVNQVTPAESREKKIGYQRADVMEKEFVEQAFFEYHIYDLQRKTTIKDRQTKQVNLLQAQDIKTVKEYVVAGQNYYYANQYAGDQKIKSPVNVLIKFKNEKENNLGMPLPAGIMRLYKEDTTGSLQFIGEDRIDHTPKDEEVKLKTGEAFDIVAERVQTNYLRPGPRTTHTEWEVTVRNHKEEAVDVVLVEPMEGDWRILDSSHPFEKVNAFTARFKINVPQDGETKVTYKVLIRHP